MRSRKRMLGMEFNSKLFLIFLVLLPVLITGFTLLYPFALVSGEIEPAILGADFEEKIQAQESQLKPRPGTEKKIFWANDKKNKTPVSIVYLHGWSASRQELSPTVERVASEMKANLFMTRLTGHGLDGEALGRVTTENLLQDAEDALVAEAVEIYRSM